MEIELVDEPGSLKKTTRSKNRDGVRSVYFSTAQQQLPFTTDTTNYVVERSECQRQVRQL